MSTAEVHATAGLAEADRLMVVCNSCRYCEGLCAVFPAMEMRRAFADGDLNYLANLCHACGACYVDCQFAPPHAFQVNVPAVLAEVRADSYAAYAWPGAFAPLFARNGRAVGLAAGFGILAMTIALALLNPAGVFVAGSGPGLFYRLMPHAVMASLFGAAFAYALLALAMGLTAFWRDIGEPAATLGEPLSLWSALKDAASLRYLDGGKAGCFTDEAASPDHRRLFHHLTAYGFLLCFASTVTATAYHYLLGREAPYALADLPVLLGLAGGAGLLIGPIGLALAKRRRNIVLDTKRRGMDDAFLAMLFATGLTGLALLAFRSTPAMGALLALHLGVVLGLFLTLPYGKFVHGLYRFAALVRYAKEQRRFSQGA